MKTLLTLGRQPALGLAELESLFGAAAVSKLGEQAALLSVEVAKVPFKRLGGAVKICRVINHFDATTWRQVEKQLLQLVPLHVANYPNGKLQLGISVQGFDLNVRQLEATGLSLKKAIRRQERSVRLIPNNELELNTAQVFHNKLTGPMGLELVVVSDGSHTVIAQTIDVQDIASYAYRDRERPRRDARVGMLPPKLAQIIVNLAVGHADNNTSNSVILDPFCGTGVLLQEATLMGYTPYGTDIEQRMIDYSSANLIWLNQQYHLDLPAEFAKLAKGDATNFKWDVPIDYVAGETYLGKPFTKAPTAEALVQTIQDCNLIIKKFLRNIHGQIPSGTRLCLAVPAWASNNSSHQFKMLPLVDQLRDLGYNRISFEHAEDDEMIYFRPDQFVARQLLVITKQ